MSTRGTRVYAFSKARSQAVTDTHEEKHWQRREGTTRKCGAVNRNQPIVWDALQPPSTREPAALPTSSAHRQTHMRTRTPPPNTTRTSCMRDPKLRKRGRVLISVLLIPRGVSERLCVCAFTGCCCCWASTMADEGDEEHAKIVINEEDVRLATLASHPPPTYPSSHARFPQLSAIVSRAQRERERHVGLTPVTLGSSSLAYR